MASRRVGLLAVRALGQRHVSLGLGCPELRCTGTELCHSSAGSDRQLPRQHRCQPTTPAGNATRDANSGSHPPFLTTPTTPSSGQGHVRPQRQLTRKALAGPAQCLPQSPCFHSLGPPPLRDPCFHPRSCFHSLGTPPLRGQVQELKLAQTGEGIAECELLQWFVREGDEVKPFQLVCQVQSDKATVDITSRFGGRLVRTHFVPGDVIKVGETLADILEKDSPSAAASASSPSAPEQGDQEQVKGGGQGEAQAHTGESSEGMGEKGAVHQGATGGPREGGKAGAVLATPAVRHLARGYGVSLADVAGSGPSGRVLKEDVVRFVAMRQAVQEEARMEEESLEGPDPETPVAPAMYPGSAAGQAAQAHAQAGEGMQGAAEARSLYETSAVQGLGEESAWSPGGAPETAGAGTSHPRDTEIPIRGYRRAMVKAMAAAAAIPHFNFMDEFDVTTLAELVARLNTPSSPSFPSPPSSSSLAPPSSPGSVVRSSGAGAEREMGLKLTHLPFLVKALSLALLRFPALNATVDPDVTTIRCSGSHNIGIAMATPHGLVVPNVKSCESRSVAEIASDIRRLRQLASANQLSQGDLAGGTITISNIGAVGGGTYACPLVFQPQLAIVALGRVRWLPRFDQQGDVCAASIMNVSWAADHRVVDGAALAGLSMEWQRLVESPERLLLALR